MADWQDEQQSGRRFAHRSQGRKGGRHNGRNGDKELFKPRNMLGRYAVRHPAFDSSTGAPQDSWLEIHELDVTETGFIASFDFRAVSGIMLIAGSRKALKALVEAHDCEESEEEEEEEDEPSDEDNIAKDHGSEDAAGGEDEDSSDDEDSATTSQPDDNFDFARPPDLDRPSHNFEKNTFRQPKWFAQWRGQATPAAIHYAIANNHRKGMSDQQIQEDAPWHTVDDGNKAHLEFATGSCRDFNATFSCPYLGLKNVSIHGWKETSKPTDSTAHWRAFHEYAIEER